MFILRGWCSTSVFNNYSLRHPVVFSPWQGLEEAPQDYWSSLHHMRWSGHFLVLYLWLNRNISKWCVTIWCSLGFSITNPFAECRSFRLAADKSEANGWRTLLVWSASSPECSLEASVQEWTPREAPGAPDRTGQPLWAIEWLCSEVAAHLPPRVCGWVAEPATVGLDKETGNKEFLATLRTSFGNQKA